MMKLGLRVSVLILMCASVAAAQTKAQETPPKTQEPPKAQEAPKTQETAASPAATQTASRQEVATVTDSRVPAPPATETTIAESKAPVAGHRVASAKEVKNLYIEPMVHDLDKSLMAEFSRQLAGRIVIVSKPEDADAVMTGIGEWHNGTAQAVSEHLVGPHDPRGAVEVLSKGSLLWASEAWGHLKNGGQHKVADRIVHNFKNALAGKVPSETFY